MATQATHVALPPLEGRQRLLATLVISLAGFMYALDLSVANVSIPTIAGDLGVSPGQATWVITSYAVANAIVTPLTGWLAARIGQVRLFAYCILLFVTTSLMCGLAPNLPLLLVGRCLQGAVAAPMMPMSTSLLLQSYPPNKAPTAMATSMFTMMFAPIFGPIIGGYLTENFAWPWIFYINIPIGLFCAWATVLLFRKRESRRIKLPVDYIGVILLVIWVGALQLMLDLGRELGWFESGEIVMLAVVALIGFCLFAAWEWYEAHPIVDFKLFTVPSFTVGVMAASVWSIAYMGAMVQQPLWLQQTLGYTATWAGMVVAPGALFAVLMQPIAGKVVHKVGIRGLATFGLVVLSIACFMRTGFTPDMAPINIIHPQLVNGFGSSAFTLASSLMVFSALPQWRIAAASGISSFFRLMGTALGTSIATTVWDNRTILHHGQLVSHVSAYDAPAGQYIDALGSLGVDPTMALGMIDRQATIQSQTMATIDYNWVSLILYIVVIAIFWTTRPGKPQGQQVSMAAAEH
ncbi:MAG: DHA2 family efflux MFS transporter permease subunit [Proteobacteria bacterium]|nr:DHA2 family efflux MFS transporter permease subunit [Pseudomonadota bacterium]HQR04268.1 DHA2 family efflux MFS transporter permease subunit [Rhodocyclaceae bacterium]